MKLKARWFGNILLVISFIFAVHGSGFDVQTDHNGNYNLLIDGTKWMSSAEPFVYADNAKHDAADGTLKMMLGPVTSQGRDDVGTYEKTTFVYGWPNTSKTWEVSVLKYTSEPIVVFEQFFPTTFNKTSSGDANKLISSFPSFSLPSDQELGLLAYAGVFFYSSDVIQRFEAGMRHVRDGIDGGPWVIFDSSGHTLVVSPLNEFMASSVVYDSNAATVSWGVMGNAGHVPAGFTYKTIVFYSNNGINHAMERWGECMRHVYKKDKELRYQDPTVRYLGYYTDHGAYYHWLTEPGMNYEETLLAVVKYAQKEHIPYRYLQYDDWWYYITKDEGYGATIEWEPKPSVFPDGMRYIYNITRLPVVAHNRYWSTKTVYAKQNGGEYDFVMDKDKALPLEQSFWEHLFSTAVQWGLAVYEQDFLTTQSQTISWLSSDVTLGRRWLTQMGEAASGLGLRIQYCMALPRHVLQSLEIPQVTQIRSSEDYINTKQWKIGISSMLANAVGLAPFKDNFWSSSIQPGNKDKRNESSPLLQAAISLLSTGPVGPGDRINYSNPKLIKSLAREDGTLLKPSKPATAIDAQIYERAFGGGVGPKGEVYTTYSIVSGNLFGVILAADLMDTYILSPELAGFGPHFTESIIYSHTVEEGSRLATFGSASSLKLSNCTYDDFCLYYTSPVFNMSNGHSVAIIGELEKLLPISPHRIAAVDVLDDDILITIIGSEQEKVAFYLYYDHQQWLTYTCVLSVDGKATISFKHYTCNPM